MTFLYAYLAVGVLLSIVTFAASLAYFQGRFWILAEKDFWGDFFTSIAAGLMIIIFPPLFVGVIFVTHKFNYGLQWWKRDQVPN